jgi:hypothetical protein
MANKSVENTGGISTKLHFPARLYQVIEIEDPSIIAWEISGASFRIVDSKRFRSETIPKYFRRKCSIRWHRNC